jgi:hypothetical protein
MASADVQPSLAMAQRLADALAAGDWATARQLDPGLRSQSDEALEDGYGGLDQATLLLVDAAPTADGHDLLVVLIANERAGAQTSLYCAGTTVSGGSTVHQRDAALLERFPGTVGIDDVRQDEAIVEMIRQRCGR